MSRNPLIFEGVDARHPYALIIWPFLVPIFDALITARFELRDFPPIPDRLTTVTGILRDLIMEAELGLLGSPPEQMVAALHGRHHGRL